MPDAPEYLSFPERAADAAGDAKCAETPPSGASPPPFDHLTDRELFDRLGWFISIRWVAGVVALLLVFIARVRFDVRIPPGPVVLTICGLFLYNAVFLMLVADAYRQRRVSRRFIVRCAGAQTTCDLITLAILMHFTGGIENYFLVFFVCPLIVVSECLSVRSAYAHAALGAVLIHGVAWSEFAGVLPHVQVGRAMGTETYRNTLSVMQFTIALSSLLFAVVFLHSSIANRLRQREKELEFAYDRLAKLEESKSFVMRKTSHELRAPLNAVTAMLHVIKLETTSPEQAHLNRFVDRALHRTKSLAQLIEELHRYATLRDAASALQKRRVDFADVVRQNVSLFSPMAEEKSLHVSVSTEPAHVTGDPEALSEVASNLIVNAIQYTPAGGDVRVTLLRNGADVRFDVADTGIGIRPDALNRVFDEFYRTPEAKSAFSHGTGMGLPIVRRIVEAHGGSIEVESTLGRGTTFRVYLPLAATAKSAAAGHGESTASD